MPRNITNRIRLVRSYLSRRERLGAFPFEIAIGITNRCNLDCSFCPQKGSLRPRGNISLGLLAHLLEQAALFVDTVDLSFDGEPFLHPRWAECVEACHRCQVRPILQTNALLLDESLAREVIRARLYAITFSLDAASPETYRRIKPGGDFTRAVGNAERFIRMAAGINQRPRITVQFVRCPENAHETGTFIRYWRSKGADSIRIKPMFNFGGSVGSIGAPVHKKPCILLWTSLSIHWDGIVPMCCMEIEGRSSLGDASRQTLAEIIDDEAFISLRRLHLVGRCREHPVCRNCDIPAIVRPLVFGSAFVGDWTRRQIISNIHKFGFLNKKP